MRQFRNHSLFNEAEPGETYQQAVRGLLDVRSEAPVYVYWKENEETAEVLVGYGSEPFQIEMLPGQFQVVCDRRVWIAQNSVQQFTVASTDEVFTTLDRPPPLTPEMEAIARLVRQNNVERERMYAEFERRDAETRREFARRQDPVDVEPDRAASEETSEDPKSSEGKPAKRATRKAKPAEKPQTDERRGVDDSEED